MDYYIGTEQECIDYDTFVTENENYIEGDNWANPIKNPTEYKWAILKHPKYTTELYDVELNIIESLGSDWFPDSV